MKLWVMVNGSPPATQRGFLFHMKKTHPGAMYGIFNRNIYQQKSSLNVGK